MEKTCKRCLVAKKIDFFTVDKRLKTGRSGTCSECRHKIEYDYRKRHPDRIAERTRRRYEKNKDTKEYKEKSKIWRKEYYEENKQKELSNNKKYSILNEEKIKINHIKYREKNREEINDKIRKRRETCISPRVAGWKHGAKRRNIPWLIQDSDFDSMPLLCFYTNIELTLKPNKFNTVSLDRIYNDKPYTKDNAVFCCWWINQMKNDFLPEEFVSLCEKIVENKIHIINSLKILN